MEAFVSERENSYAAERCFVVAPRSCRTDSPCAGIAALFHFRMPLGLRQPPHAWSSPRKYLSDDLSEI